MSFVSHYACTHCGHQLPLETLPVPNLCPVDRRPLQLMFDLDALESRYPDNTWYHPEIKSMWRFGALLALDAEISADRAHIVSDGEGYTPLLALQNFTLAKPFSPRTAGFELWLKDEGQPHPGFGRNPSGSFKDRGMSMAVSMALAADLTKLVVPTQGNAGDSLVHYVRLANARLGRGIEAAVIMPEDTPMPILGRVAARAKQDPHIKLDLVSGTIREASELMKKTWIPQGYFNLATFQEPGWRIEGKKTLGLEIAEPGNSMNVQSPCASVGSWSLPDVILYPTGGGTGILGMWKAFAELQQLGLIDDRRPRFVSVQSEVTAPIVAAFVRGDADTTAVTAGQTLATGLNVPGGVGHQRVLHILRASGGGAVAVSEQAIAQALVTGYREHGLWLTPEGAATLAALEAAWGNGLIRPGDRVVACNTGSFEKYLPQVRSLLFGCP